MNPTMIETFKIMNVFEMFKKYEHVGPTKLADMEWFVQMCKKDGYPAIADFFEEWLASIHYNIAREYDVDDEE